VEIVVGVAILWVVPIVVAVGLGNAKHRPGFLYGLLSWVGVILLAVLPARPAPLPEDLQGTPWDETHRPSDDSFFQNAQYYSKH
jgi:hypothetical protein